MIETSQVRSKMIVTQVSRNKTKLIKTTSEFKFAWEETGRRTWVVDLMRIRTHWKMSKSQKEAIKIEMHTWQQLKSNWLRPFSPQNSQCGDGSYLEMGASTIENNTSTTEHNLDAIGFSRFGMKNWMGRLVSPQFSPILGMRDSSIENNCSTIKHS